MYLVGEVRAKKEISVNSEMSQSMRGWGTILFQIIAMEDEKKDQRPRGDHRLKHCFLGSG